MKYIEYFLVLLLIPFIVLAEECDVSKITITSLEQASIEGNTEVVEEPTFQDRSINLNLKMYDVGDSITYNMTIKNDSNEDYVIDEGSLNHNMDYMKYEFINENQSITLKPNEEKELQIRITYNSKVPAENLNNGVLNNTNKVVLNLSNSKKNSIKEIITNPNTNDKITIIIAIFLISFIIIKTVKPKKTFNKYLLFVLLFIIPMTIYAVCKCDIEIEANIVINEKEATFLKGRTVNVIMKTLAGDDLSSETNPHTFIDSNIVAIKKSDNEPIDANKEDKNLVSTPESENPIYMWYEDGTIYWWSEAIHPSLNENSSYFFGYLKNLEEIESISNWNSSDVKYLSFLFCWDETLTTLSPLESWDTSNVQSLRGFCTRCKKMQDVSAIKYWNVEKVTNISYLFNSNYEVEEVDLSHWATPSLTDMSNSFGMWDDNSSPYYDAKIKRIKMSDKFDTSKVTNMYALFANNKSLEDYSFLQYIDVSNSENIAQFFQYNLNLKDEDLEYIKNWDVRNVKNMHGLFIMCKDLTVIDLSKWETPNVEKVSAMFSIIPNLEEVDISGFDTSKVTSFWYMFDESPSLRHIYVGENWDTSANTNGISPIFPESSYLPNFNTSNPNYRSLSYAHTGDGGYLTLKNN